MAKTPTQEQSAPEELLNYYPTDVDGYTLPCYFGANRNLTGEVRFRYKPTDVLERAVVIQVNSDHAEKVSTKMFARLLAEKITEWDIKVKVPGGEMVPMPISPENLLALKPTLWVRFLNVVLWSHDAGDVDPKSSLAQVKEEIDEDFEALFAGARPGEARAASVEKN